MTSPSSSLFLVLLLLSHLFTHQTYAMRKLPGSDIKKEIREPSMDVSEKPSVEGGGDDIQRKVLHEVHSGPNPISNSVPRRWWKTKSGRKP